MRGYDLLARVVNAPLVRRLTVTLAHVVLFFRALVPGRLVQRLVLAWVRMEAACCRSNTPHYKFLLRYMAQMGQGVRPLMELAGESKEGCACYHEYLDEEMHRMGLPLSLSINGLPKELAPIGPAVPRFTVIPVELPEGQGPVKVKITATPRFWEVSDVSLAPATTVNPELQVLAPTSALDQAGRDRLAQLVKNDQARVSLSHGEHVDVSFAAPPLAPGKKRTVLAKLRGYYDLDIGGMKGVHLGFILAHRFGWVSLPEFAKTL